MCLLGAYRNGRQPGMCHVIQCGWGRQTFTRKGRLRPKQDLVRCMVNNLSMLWVVKVEFSLSVVVIAWDETGTEELIKI